MSDFGSYGYEKDTDALIAQGSPGQGIDCTIKQLQNGTCSFNVNQAVGIRQQSPNNDVGIFVQDVILGATTFIGTILVLSIITSAIMMILGGANGSESLASRGKKGLGLSIVGFLLVLASYMIIRLIQYVARG